MLLSDAFGLTMSCSSALRASSQARLLRRFHRAGTIFLRIAMLLYSLGERPPFAAAPDVLVSARTTF